MVFQIKKKNLLWLFFGTASIATFLIYRYLWFVEFYWLYLCIIGVLNLFIGIIIVRYSGFKIITILFVIFGLIIGQWWFLELFFARVLWRLGGFAP